MNVLKDRQLIVSPGPTTGVVTVGTDANYDCLVSFRGRAVSAQSIGKNTLVAGDIVSMADIDGLMFAVKQSAGYPTRYKRPLTDWAARHPANMLLQLCLQNAKKEYTYRLGVVSSVAGDNSLIVECWDGRTRQCPVEYADELRSSSAFAAGESVALHQKVPNNWIVIGKLATLTASPSSIDFGDVSVATGSDPVAVDVEQIGSTAAITVTAPSSFAVGATSGGTFSGSVALPGAGGIFYAKATPSAIGQYSGSISVSSADASAAVPVDAIGIPSIVITAIGGDTFATHVCDGFPQYGDVKTVTISAFGVTGDISIISDGDLEIASSAAGPWERALTLTGSANIYTRLAPEYTGYSAVEEIPVDGIYVLNPGSIIGDWSAYIQRLAEISQIERPISGSISASAFGISPTIESLSGIGQEITSLVIPAMGGIYGNVPPYYYRFRGYATVSRNNVSWAGVAALIQLTCRASLAATIAIEFYGTVSDDISVDTEVGPHFIQHNGDYAQRLHTFTTSPL